MANPNPIYPPCETDSEMDKLSQSLRELHSLVSVVVEHQIVIYNQVKEMHEMFVRIRPMIERYEQAAKAQGFRAQRAALKGKNNG